MHSRRRQCQNCNIHEARAPSPRRPSTPALRVTPYHIHGLAGRPPPTPPFGHASRRPASPSRPATSTDIRHPNLQIGAISHPPNHRAQLLLTTAPAPSMRNNSGYSVSCVLVSVHVSGVSYSFKRFRHHIMTRMAARNRRGDGRRGPRECYVRFTCTSGTSYKITVK